MPPLAHTTPIRRVYAVRNRAGEAGIWPSVRAPNQTVPDRVVVNVIHMPIVISFIPNHVLPEAPLPHTAFLAFPSGVATGGLDASAGKVRTGEATLDQPPAKGEPRIARRQCPDAMQVIRQHHDGLDCKGVPLINFPKRRAQRIQGSCFSQNPATGIGHYREEKRRPGHDESSILRHCLGRVRRDAPIVIPETRCVPTHPTTTTPYTPPPGRTLKATAPISEPGDSRMRRSR